MLSHIFQAVPLNWEKRVSIIEVKKSNIPLSTDEKKVEQITAQCSTKLISLFVFQRDDPKQNGVKLLTLVSDLVFNALSHGTIHLALYGSSLNQNLIG